MTKEDAQKILRVYHEDLVHIPQIQFGIIEYEMICEAWDVLYPDFP